MHTHRAATSNNGPDGEQRRKLRTNYDRGVDAERPGKAPCSLVGERTHRSGTALVLACAGALALAVAGPAGAALATPPADPPADVVVEPTPTPTVTPVPTPTPGPTPTPPVETVPIEESVGAALFAEDAVPLAEPRTPLGALVVQPAKGAVTVEITVTTASACPEAAEFTAVEFGPVDVDGTTVEFGDDVVGTTPAPIATPGQPVTVRTASFAEAAEGLDAPLTAGTYGLSMVCLTLGEDDEATTDDIVEGLFLTVVYLTSATEFQTTPPGAGTTTPTPTPTATPTPTPTATPTPTPAATIVPASNTTNTGSTNTAATTGGSLAFTGAPIATLTTFGGGLAGLGALLVLVGRLTRRPGRVS